MNVLVEWMTPTEVTKACGFSHPTYVYREIKKGHFEIEIKSGSTCRSMLIARASVVEFLTARARRNARYNCTTHRGGGGHLFAPKGRLSLACAAKRLALESGLRWECIAGRLEQAHAIGYLSVIDKGRTHYVRLVDARKFAYKTVRAVVSIGPVGYIRASRAAELLGVSRQRIGQLIRSGVLGRVVRRVIRGDRAVWVKESTVFARRTAQEIIKQTQVSRKKVKVVVPSLLAEWIDEAGVRWKSIPGTDNNFAVSADGRVRNKTRELAICLNTDGYPHTGVKFTGQKRRIYAIHKLVLLAFVGPRPAGLVSCHLDGNKRNNKLDNLCYGTRHQTRGQK